MLYYAVQASLAGSSAAVAASQAFLDVTCPDYEARQLAGLGDIHR